MQGEAQLRIQEVPMQFTILGSGSHSPFLAHVAELGPINISPSRQLNVMFPPSKAGSLKPSIITSVVTTRSGL